MSAQHDDGGPAFPRPKSHDPERYSDPEAYQAQEGMTLRDWFAGKALQGLMANPNVVGFNANCGWSLVNCKPEDIANFSKVMANAMLAERNAP